VPDGRAKHLAAACDASRAALGVDRIDLYLLHAPDPRTALATSVRALAKLRDAGAVGAIGLCNVTVGQLEEARGVTGIDAVQVALSPSDVTSIRGGLVEHCRDEGIMLIAHTPLGGAAGVRRLGRDAAFGACAERHGITPGQAALAWARDLAPNVIPIPGARRVETAREAGAVAAVTLDDDDRARLDEAVPAGRFARSPLAALRPAPDADGDVVLIMGYPAAGKSTAVASFVADGYGRLNRDAAGGRLADLLPDLDRALATGRRRVVLDNTYPTRASRRAVVEVAWRHGAPVRCVWLQTSLEDAQVNAVRRMLVAHDTLLEPDAMKRAARNDSGVIPPRAQFEYRRTFEPPTEAEGLARVEPVPFVRRAAPGTTRAVVVEYDGLLRASRGGGRTPTAPDDVEILPGRASRLQRCRDEGYRLLGTAWRPELETGALDSAVVHACFERTNAELGVEIDVVHCPHRAGPPVCWCRKPLPGLGVLLVERHGLDPAQCVHVGTGAADRAFAERLGFTYVDADEFFAEERT
jgi:diketogulonate reductase-like aldo/keto reductase/histidinol phosphatase-like enzyme